MPLETADAVIDDEPIVETAPEESVVSDEPPVFGDSQPDTPEPAAEPEVSPPSPAAAASSLRDQLAARGIPVSGNDDASAIEHLASNYRQLQELANFGYQARPQWNQFQAFLAQQAAQQQAPVQPVAPKEPKFKPLEYDAQWESLVTRDEQGNIVPKSQYVDPSVPQKLMAYQTAMRERLSSFANDPQQFVQETVGDYVQEQINQAIEQRWQAEQARQQEYSFANQAIGQHADLFFAKDASGNQMLDPNSGRPVLTPAGNAYANAVSRLAQAGVSDTTAQHYMALGQLAEANMLSGRRAQASGAAPATPDKRAQFLAKTNPATRTPNRNGMARQADRNGEVSQNPSKSLVLQMLDDARAAGLSLEEV
jgi:hypothetical protein